MGYIVIFFSAMLINNIILMQFLGLCSFFGISNKMKPVVGMSLAVIAVIVLSAAITYPIYYFVLDKLNLTYLNIIVFALIIAAVVQLTEMIIKKISTSLYRALGVYLPLIATNCAVLGVCLTNVGGSLNFGEAMLYALGSGIGYAIIIITFSAIRMRLDTSNVPKAFKGLPIAFVTTGLMALAFMGLAGII